MDPEKTETILAAAQDLLPWMIEIRRDLHQHPELGLEEHRTIFCRRSAKQETECANLALLNVKAK